MYSIFSPLYPIGKQDAETAFGQTNVRTMNKTAVLTNAGQINNNKVEDSPGATSPASCQSPHAGRRRRLGSQVTEEVDMITPMARSP